MCTKHEALSILRGWHESNTPLLLKLQPVPGAEPLFIKGRIAHLVSDELVFGNPALSVTVGFGQVSFEFQELAKRVNKLATQGTSMCELKLQLSAAQNPSFRDELIMPETTVIISEMTV